MFLFEATGKKLVTPPVISGSQTQSATKNENLNQMTPMKGIQTSAKICDKANITDKLHS